MASIAASSSGGSVVPQASVADFDDFCWDLYPRVTARYERDPDLARRRTEVLHAVEAGAEGLDLEAALHLLRPQWTEVPFLGCDGLPRGGRRDVDEGRLAGTVVMPSCAGPAVELAAAWLAGGPPPPAETVLRPSPYPAP